MIRTRGDGTCYAPRHKMRSDRSRAATQAAGLRKCRGRCASLHRGEIVAVSPCLDVGPIADPRAGLVGGPGFSLTGLRYAPPQPCPPEIGKGGNRPVG
jgi:hypothetical protein